MLFPKIPWPVPFGPPPVSPLPLPPLWVSLPGVEGC